MIDESRLQFANRFLAAIASLPAGAAPIRPASARSGKPDTHNVAQAIATRVFETLTDDPNAAESAHNLMAQLKAEYSPQGPLAQLTLDHLAIVHVQLLQVRAMWSAANELDDIERLTRLQNRIAAEFFRLVGMLDDTRHRARPVIAQANIAVAEQQVVTQGIVPNELGGKDG